MKLKHTPFKELSIYIGGLFLAAIIGALVSWSTLSAAILGGLFGSLWFVLFDKYKHKILEK